MPADRAGRRPRVTERTGDLKMAETMADRNRSIVLEAFETLFNKRDYAAAERFWSDDYIQHSAHIEPGRQGLFSLVKSLPPELHHEVDLAMAEGDMVMVRGRFSGIGLPAPWIAADFVRMEDGLLKEHWDIIEDEASREASASGLPMYGDTFPEDG
jgi:predicted SnoaL-like aldol condensation-catalyzing enzyme